MPPKLQQERITTLTHAQTGIHYSSDSEDSEACKQLLDDLFASGFRYRNETAYAEKVVTHASAYTKQTYVYLNARINQLGLKTAVKIPANTHVFNYAGEVIDLPEKDKRLKAGRGDHIMLLEAGEVLFVDGGTKGNEARFLNHSCLLKDQNLSCRARIEGGKAVVKVYSASHDIAAGTELHVTYVDAKEPIERRESTILRCRCPAFHHVLGTTAKVKAREWTSNGGRLEPAHRVRHRGSSGQFEKKPKLN